MMIMIIRKNKDIYSKRSKQRRTFIESLLVDLELLKEKSDILRIIIVVRIEKSDRLQYRGSWVYILLTTLSPNISLIYCQPY